MTTVVTEEVNLSQAPNWFKYDSWKDKDYRRRFDPRVLTHNGVGTVLCLRCNVLNLVRDSKFECGNCDFKAGITDCACKCGEQLLDRNLYGSQIQYIRNHRHLGRNHWNYKIGKETTKEGYVTILVNYSHPRKHKGKVFEHVLVMERHIGRFITTKNSRI
jgi:hypothetical protein